MKKLLSIVLSILMVVTMLPTAIMPASAAGDYAYIDADGNQKSVSAATTVLSDTTAWSSGWYYVDSDVTISSRITVSGDVKLILGAGCTLTASQGIHVSGGNALTVYSQETAGTLIAIGTEYSAAIGGNGKNGAGGEDVDTSVGTIEINGGNITATGGRYGAAIGGGWGGKNGNITINRGSVTATGGDYGAGIGTSQMATDTVNITITGGTVNATGGRGAASIGIGYGAEESNGAVINITGGNITAARNWASASIGNGVGVNSATTISITGGVIDAEVIGNYNGGWTAVVKDICGAGFKQNPSDLLDSTQYTELKDGLYYVYWKKASAVISTSVSGSPSVWVDGIATSHTGTRYQNGKLYIYGIPAGNVKATLNGTDYYGVLANTSAETELKPGYVKATGITLNSGSITAGAPIDLANYVVFQPQSVTFQHKITAEVVMESTTSVCTLNGSVLTASAGKVTVKITASDGYSSCSGTFSFDVAESDNLDIAYGNIEIAQKSDGNYDVSYPGFAGGKKTYGATEGIVITGTTEEYSVKVLSGTPTVVLNNCNITTWFTDDSTASPFAISSGATAYLMLQGESTLKITSTTNTGEVAAIAVPGGAALYINGTGILNVIGKHSAGAIGGKYDELLGDITINGGTVNADYYARNEYDVYYGTTISGSNITINGGTVTAKAGMYGTAIGSGYNSEHATTVTINGGVVNASAVMYGYGEGVAIGNADNSQANCSVTINGGTVTALSTCAGAAIGSAWINNANVSTNVTINGGTVTATSDLYGAGIGGGQSGSGVAVTINGGTVTATGNYGAGIGGGYNGNGGTVTITGGNIKSTATNSNAIGAGKNASEECVVSDGKGNSVSLNAITLEGAIANTAVSAIKGVTYGLKDVKTLDTDKLYFYLPSGTVATTITAGSVEYICNRNLTYYTEHEYKDATCITPQTCQYCGHTAGEATFSHNYVNGVCTVCGMGEADGIFYISTAEQLMMFADYVNYVNKDADAVLMADIDLAEYTWTPIGVTAMGEGVTNGYTGSFDGNGHVIRNVTFATPTSAMAAGIFGTVQSGGTVRNLGVENLSFDDNTYDHRAGGIAGQLLADSTISDCYVINSTVKASSRVVGGIVGMNNGTVKNCYTYNMTLAGYNNRFGGISGDFSAGKLENCYTDYSALASSQAGTTANCKAGVSADVFASGEIAYLLNGSTSEGELVWGQLIGTDSYPVFGGETVYYNESKGFYNILHTCDFSGEWKYDADKHWKGCTVDGCSETSEEAEHSYTNGKCDCGYTCPHDSYTDGVCDKCGYECAHEWGEGVLTRPVYDAVLGSKDGYYTYTCTVCGEEKKETVKSADYSAYEAVSEEINALLQSDELTDAAKQAIYSAANECGLLSNDLTESEQNKVDNLVAELEKIIADAEEKIASGEYVKADYTEINKAIKEIEDKFFYEDVTDEGKAGLEEIKKQLEEMKADENTSEADLAELEKELEAYEEELDKGIEDGTLVMIRPEKIGAEISDKWKEWLEAEGLTDELEDFVNNQKATDEAMATVDEINDFANSLEGTVAENAENIAKLNEMLDSLLESWENCLRGTHNFKDYEITSPAKCEVNAKETSTCWFCGETDEREVEGTALTHSFTKYEETEAPKCGVAGKKTAYCDHGCGATDEKEIEALTHVFDKFVSNGDATCTADGTKTASCIHGCGTEETVTDEGTKLDHADEDGDKICDDCEAEIIDVCPDCGRPVHEDEGIPHYICIIIMFIRLVVSLVKALQGIE